MLSKYFTGFFKIPINKTRININKNHCYDSNKMVNLLDELNRVDTEERFKNHKIFVKEKFGEEISENITSKELAEDLLFLHKWYIDNNASTKKDIINLRRYVKNIYSENKNLPDSIHNLLIFILKKNNAINIE